MKITCTTCGEPRNEPFCATCTKPRLSDSSDVYVPEHNGVDGLEDFGDVGVTKAPYTEPALVRDYLTKKQVQLVPYRSLRYSTSNPNGWARETVVGLPNRCPTKWAAGALRLQGRIAVKGDAGWNSTSQPRIQPEECSAEPGVFASGCSRTGVTNTESADNR